MQAASKFLHEHAVPLPTFAGLWLDYPAQEIHVAFSGTTAGKTIEGLRSRLPPEVHLVGHVFEHTLADLEGLQEQVRRYLEQQEIWRRFTVDLSIQVKANCVQLNLKHTTPPEVVEAARTKFLRSPLDIDLTTSRWSAY
jgi:hypothetical protein